MEFKTLKVITMSMMPNEGQKSMFPMIEALEKELERAKKENKELQQQLKSCNLQNNDSFNKQDILDYANHVLEGDMTEMDELNEWLNER